MLDTTRPGTEGESVTGAVEVPGGALVLLESRRYIDIPGALMMYITSLP